MKRSEKVWLGLALTAIALAGVIVLLGVSGEVAAPRPQSNETALGNGSGVREASRPAETAPVGRVARAAPQTRKDEVSSDDDSEEAVQTEQEKLVAATELLVEEFDSLVDVWRGQDGNREKSKPVTMADVDGFATAFRKLPRSRRDECIHRALNLIPDENVMLLAGILMDKEMDKGIVETVYNDILNRDESVKKPILQQIFKDKTHPCWADTAWILDVTGELPKSK